MSTVFVALVSIFLSCLAYLIYRARKINRYWKERGIPYKEPLLFFGNSLEIYFQKATQGEKMKEICDMYPNEPLVGMLDGTKPILVVKDAGYAEKVLIKDFQHFVDRGFPADESSPLDVNIFNMTGKKWRAIRNKFSPIFTTGKLRNMFDQMTSIGNSMNKVIDSKSMTCVDMKEILGCFAMDVIGSFAFGIDAGNLANGNSKFREMGKKAIIFTKSQILGFLILTHFPALGKWLGLSSSFVRIDVQKYFCAIIKDTIEYRRKSNTRRNDFVDLVLQLRDKGHVEFQIKDPDDDYLNIDSDSYKTEKYELTDDLLVGQAFIFLTAGFEGTASIINYCLYELSKNPVMQERLRNEVIEKVNKHGGKLSFDAIKEMTYLDMFLKETMRRHVPIQLLFRECTKEYTFPNGLVVKPKDMVVIGVYSIQLDPKYFPDPLKFDPERFGPDVYHEPCTWLPFGEGPRNCIAMRFAIVQMKFGIAKLAMTYRMSINSKTIEPLTISKQSFLTTPEHPIYYDLEKIYQ